MERPGFAGRSAYFRSGAAAIVTPDGGHLDAHPR